MAPLHVLIVDDETTVRLTLARAISRQDDMRVAGEAADGPSALRLVAELAPDVVLMDVTMPGPSGIDVVRQLRTIGDETPVLFFTGDPGALERAGGIEHSQVLVKAAGGMRDALAALRQVAAGGATAARMDRTSAGLRRKASAASAAASGNGSPDRTTTRRSKKSR